MHNILQQRSAGITAQPPSVSASSSAAPPIAVSRAVSRDAILQAKATPDATIHRQFGDGHAFAQHGSEFPGLDEAAFDTMVQNVMAHPDEQKALGGGRVAYWKTDTIVIYNGNDPARSTCFKPSRGKAYFDGQR